MSEDEGLTNEEVSETGDVHVRSTFHRSVDEGVERLERSWPGLAATGFVGGLDVSLGILALLIVVDHTGSMLLGALGFTIGFMALALSRSELFTENLLVPVAAIAGGKGTVRQLVRLWVGTGIMNLVGGLLVAWLIVVAFPGVHDTAVALGRVYPELPLGRALASGVIGGGVITFMTWTERGAESEIGKLVAVAMSGFLLAAGHLNHVIVASLEMFVALLTGDAPFGALDWLKAAAIATLANVAGGIGLVTVFRLMQVGRREIEAERRREPEEPREEEGATKQSATKEGGGARRERAVE